MNGATQSYRVQLPVFEGPLDLLLHLIKKNNVEIHDIPVSLILDQYLRFLELAKELDIDLAGEFLDLAAELAYIKSRMLLPEPEEEEKEDNDPREDLVKRLLEYNKFKLAARSLLDRPLLGRDLFRRNVGAPADSSGEFLEADLTSLFGAFGEILKRLPREERKELQKDRVGVAERVLELIEKMRGQPSLLFESLFVEEMSRSEIVVTFLALLEMARQKMIRIVQETTQGAVVVCPLLSDELDV
jgi:segregation and condensation protein A